MKKTTTFFFIILFLFIIKPADKNNDPFPFELSEAKEAFVFSVGLGLMTSFLFIPEPQYSLTEIQNLNKNEVNNFDRIATSQNNNKADIASDVFLYSLTAVPLLFFADKRLNRNFSNALTYIVMYSESLLISNGLANTTKIIFERKRPYVYNGSLSYKQRISGDSNLSFPSGHTVNAFNAAVFLSTVFSFANPDSKWIPVVWTVSLSAAVTTGILRVAAGKHYPTDVIAGAVLGSLTGFIVPLLHKTKNKNLTVYPMFSDEYAGIDMTLIY